MHLSFFGRFGVGVGVDGVSCCVIDGVLD